MNDPLQRLANSPLVTRPVRTIASGVLLAGVVLYLLALGLGAFAGGFLRAFGN